MSTGVYKRKPMSEETRKKISEANKGKKKSKKHCENISKAKIGIKLSDECKRKISRSNKGKHHSPKTEFKKGIKHTEKTKKKIGRKKDKHWNWQGGKSFEPYGLKFNKQLKNQIRKRDNYQCQECKTYQDKLRTKTGRKYKLHIHHIDYNKKNNNSNNLISLCRNCHMKTNFKRDDWTKYFNKIIIKQ